MRAVDHAGRQLAWGLAQQCGQRIGRGRALRAQRSAAAYSLAALLGQTPGQLPAGVIDCAHAPSLAQPLPVGDGRALLQRRPDVRQAERRLASATARIGVATAELYPDIRLGASVGAAGLLEDFGTPMTQQWSIGPLISWTCLLYTSPSPRDS